MKLEDVCKYLDKLDDGAEYTHSLAICGDGSGSVADSSDEQIAVFSNLRELETLIQEKTDADGQAAATDQTGQEQ